MPSLISRFSRSALGAAVTSLSFLVPAAPASAQVSVTTSHNNNARTGLNSAETVLNTSNVNAAHFGRIFSRTVDSKLWCQPLYVPNVAVPGKGTHNVVYVASELGTVYAFDADIASQSAPLWSVSLLSKDATQGKADQNVSSPVIDPSTGTIYLTLKSFDSGWKFRIYALDIRSGAVKSGSGGVMTATVTGNAKGSVGGKLTFSAESQKQRPGLLLQGGKIYAAFGGSVDEYDPYVAWNGWIMVYDAATLRQEQVFTVAPNGNGGGIWQAGNGMSVDASGNIYAITGNGNGFGKDGTGELYSFSADKGGVDYGNTLLKLLLGPGVGTKDGTIDYGGNRLNVVDYFTPYNWKYIETADQDLGSSGVLQIPGTPYMVTGDKIGRLYTLDSRNLGKFQANNNSQIVNDFQAWRGNLHGGMVYYPGIKYGPLVYGWSENDHLKAFKVSDLTTRGASISPAMSSNAVAPPGMPGGFLSISSNGTKAGSAVVWAYTPYLGDANQFIVPGILHAFDADDISRELWNSKMVSSRDDSGLFGKFSNPTVANGKVYLSTFSNRLAVYGLIPAKAVPAAPLNLLATGAIQKVTLKWTASANATSYTIKRANYATGTYTVVADSIIPTTFDDTGVTAGQAYYYVVTANNSGGSSSNSNVAKVTPFNPAAGSVLSINFNGTSTYFGNVTSMAANEMAGVVAVPNWNDAKSNSGNLANITANGGGSTAAKISWTSEVAVSTVIPDQAGDYRMMKGYLSNDSETPITVGVQSLPANFVQSGYDVYVYCDGVNPTATRAAKFTIGKQTLQTSDAENRDFEGRYFEPGVANVGNTVVFHNLNLASFDLVVTHGESEDTTPRAPINGFQIVAHQGPPASTQPGVPANLSASPGFNQVGLFWSVATNANSYVVKRGDSPSGPFNTIASVSSNGYVDLSAKNGTTYYYAVLSSNGTLQSVLSNVVAATPQAGFAGRSLNVNFGGASTPDMAASEAAGYAVRSGWNNVSGPSGTKANLTDPSGMSTVTGVSWNATSTGDLAVTDKAGHVRMMRGYLVGDQSSATVTISSLPADFLSNGYDVYVYSDSNNSGLRTAKYSIGSQSAVVSDSPGQFNGTYVAGNDTSGNVLVFSNLKTASFTLTATALTSADGTLAAPINGIQIIARNASPVSASIPTTLSSSPKTISSAYELAGNINTVYADGDGNADIANAYLRIANDPNDTAPLDVYYKADINRLYLWDGTGWIGGYAPGTNQVITGPRGSLNCAKTAVSRSGSTLTMGWNLTPNQAMVGTKAILSSVRDLENQVENWRNFGTWTVTAPAAAAKTNASSNKS